MLYYNLANDEVDIERAGAVRGGGTGCVVGCAGIAAGIVKRVVWNRGDGVRITVSGARS